MNIDDALYVACRELAAILDDLQIALIQPNNLVR